MKEAMYYTKLANKAVQCDLCPHHCKIIEGKLGICRVRRNKEGVLHAESYGLFSAIHLDPIEKKPLFHFYPGSFILSVGSVGCNLACVFCQNCEISQIGVNEFASFQKFDPTSLAGLARKYPENLGIAYTYNEPFVFYEIISETAPIIKAQGQKNIIITNGFIEKEPLKEILPWIDAFNVDLKGFNESFYRRYTRSSLLPVLEALKQIRNSDCYLEVTNLVIPGVNDNESEFSAMINWIVDELGRSTVFHLSRYFPRYKLSIPPTPAATLKRLYEIAHEKLDYVYTGNIDLADTQNTFCPKCNALLIERQGYYSSVRSLKKDGTCLNCGYQTGIKL
ncbi:MAG: AmmeMemoRadiSam system radical SAM enzyme [Bacteroidales bacterium]